MYVSCHSHSAHMGWIRTHGLVTHTHTHGLAYTYSQRVRSLSLRSRPSLVWLGSVSFVLARAGLVRFGQVRSVDTAGQARTGAPTVNTIVLRALHACRQRCAQRVTGCLARGRASWGEFSVYSSTLDSRHACSGFGDYMYTRCGAHVVRM